ncbi:hypothetical protein CHRYSEOSP005_14820 [Chryseobacterium sp. Alg-005]|uniref:hypothetical protein n=1 Tax=Chryseobacterium sp. Alg-005 TaxID=3159516 RepID=UPI0035558E9F
MLDGKARDDFQKWMKDEMIILPEGGFSSLSDKFKASLIIDWLDVVWIVITINNTYYDGYHFFWEINIANALRSDTGFENREEATISAIKKANEIYNSRP